MVFLIKSNSRADEGASQVKISALMLQRQNRSCFHLNVLWFYASETRTELQHEKCCQ